MKWMSETQKAVFAVAFLIIVLGIAGRDDYEQAMHEQRAMCEQNPKLEFCVEVAK